MHLLNLGMSVLASLDWRTIREHYDTRVQTHQKLLELYKNKKSLGFVELLLGISDASGNYSAAEHGIGPKIMAGNSNVEQRLLEVVKQFLALSNAHEVPPIIHAARIKYFQIGVRSEVSCMVNPHFCWIANVRTIWTHLVYKHDDNFLKADQELGLYRESDVASEMTYQMWRALHAELAGTITRISEQGTKLSKESGVFPGSIRYLWADAIANHLYEDHHE